MDGNDNNGAGGPPQPGQRRGRQGRDDTPSRPRRAQAGGELRQGFDPLDAASNVFCIYYFMIQAWLGGHLGGRQEMQKRFHAALKLQIEGLAKRK